MQNVLLVRHINLFNSTNILIDTKHLNKKGVKFFARNLKGAFFSRKNQTTIRSDYKMTRHQHHPTLEQTPYHIEPKYHSTHPPNSDFNMPYRPAIGSRIQPLMESRKANHNGLLTHPPHPQLHPPTNPNNWHMAGASKKPRSKEQIKEQILHGFIE